MQNFKLGFRNKSADEQLALCERTVASLAAKPEYQFDAQQLTDAQNAVAALRASQERIAALRSELKAEISHRKQLLKEARYRVTRSSLGVRVKVNGDPAKMREAGLELEAPRTVPVGKPSAPDKISAAPTDNAGEVRLRWRRPVRRCTFEVQYSTETAPDNWKNSTPCVQQGCVVKELKSGGLYRFRVRAINAHGEGPWSRLVSARAK